MKKSPQDITTVCPWCKMGLEPEMLEKLMAKARKEKKARKLPTWWPVHEDWARDKGSQK